MELYLLRHGIAEDAMPGKRDSDRDLTAEGRRKLRDLLKVVKAAGVLPTAILSSPLNRAKETAEIAAKALGFEGTVLQSNALVPNAHPMELWEEVRMHRGEEQLLLVGHEPLFSAAASTLLNANGMRIDFKKGAMMRIDLEGFSAGPRGVLKWFFTAKLAG
jgi:phosphohistidine phosphatase